MATNKDTLFDKTLNGAYWNAGVTFHRTNPAPLEKFSIYRTLEDAQEYARTSKVSFPGQIITVIAGEQEYSAWTFTDGKTHICEWNSTEEKWYIDGIASAEVGQTKDMTTVTANGITAVRAITKPYDIKNYTIINTDGALMQITNEDETQVLSSNIDKLWQDAKGGVNYQGHIKTYREHVTEDALSLSFLIAQYYDRHEIPGTEWLWSEDVTTGKRSWLSSIPLRTGWMYCMTINEDYPIGSGKYTTKDGCEFTDRDYMIIHNHDNPELSSIQISAITREDIDIIETQDDDYVRLALLNHISNILSTDYVGKIATAKD